ncbi:MAG: hypothetical protein KKH52_03215 [Nanoarchaeota archaeon]|nr:hypothetical protein [Nanoarchaeota archaeon]
MNLRALKKEVEDLPNIEDSVDNLRKRWIKPIKKNTNLHLPSLQKLNEEERNKINHKLTVFQERLKQVKDGQLINEKLRSYACYLVELKLTTLNGDQYKSKRITNHLLYDEFHNFQQTIKEVKHLGKKVRNLSNYYEHLLESLQQHLPLEENLQLSEQPHRLQINNLLNISLKQRKLTKELGQQFVSLTRKTRMKND